MVTVKKGIAKLNLEKRILLYLILIFAFEPKLFVKIDFLNYIYIGGIVLSFIITLIKYFSKFNKPSKLLIILVIYRLSFFIQTLTSHGDITMWGYMSIVLVTLCMAIEIYAKYDFNFLLSSLINILTAITVINLLIVFVYPNGLIGDIYFIGIRTRFTEVILVNMVLSLTYDKIHNVKISKKSLFIIAVSIVTILKCWIATALLGMVLVFLLVLLFLKDRHIKLLNIYFAIIICLVLNVLIVHLRILDSLDWFFTGIFGKTTSLSGRTEIWDNAFGIIFSKPIFGHGMAVDGNFIPWVWGGIGEVKLWQAHNQWLQLLYDGGIVCVISFIAITFISYSQIKCNKQAVAKSKFLIIGIIVFYFMMIVEIYSYTPYFFVLPFVMSNMLKSKNNLKVTYNEVEK